VGPRNLQLAVLDVGRALLGTAYALADALRILDGRVWLRSAPDEGELMFEIQMDSLIYAYIGIGQIQYPFDSSHFIKEKDFPK